MVLSRRERPEGFNGGWKCLTSFVSLLRPSLSSLPFCHQPSFSLSPIFEVSVLFLSLSFVLTKASSDFVPLKKSCFHPQDFQTRYILNFWIKTASSAFLMQFEEERPLIFSFSAVSSWPPLPHSCFPSGPLSVPLFCTLFSE